MITCVIGLKIQYSIKYSLVKKLNTTYTMSPTSAIVYSQRTDEARSGSDKSLLHDFAKMTPIPMQAIPRNKPRGTKPAYNSDQSPGVTRTIIHTMKHNTPMMKYLFVSEVALINPR